jgi:hypothetical protein
VETNCELPHLKEPAFVRILNHMNLFHPTALPSGWQRLDRRRRYATIIIKWW